MAPQFLPITETLGAKLHQWVEVIAEWEGDFNKPVVEDLLMTNQYKKLPEPLKLKGELLAPHTINYYIIHSDKDKLATDPGKKMILKRVVLDGDAKLPVEDIKNLWQQQPGYLKRALACARRR